MVDQDSRIQELIEALEKATGPDRELDAIIWKVVEGRERDLIAGYIKLSGEKVSFNGPQPPAYSASIDAAMTLVPEGHDISITQASGPDRKDWSAICVKRKFYGNAVINRARASSGAIALSCSALKARARAALEGTK